MRVKLIVFALLVLAAVSMPFTAFAENDPRDSICAPGGTSLFLFYYRHNYGTDLYADGSRLSSNMDFDLDLAIFRYAHFVGLGDWTWSYDVLQPVGNLEFASNNSSGLADTNLATHMNTPYLYRNDRLSYMMSAGFYLSAPTGDYDNDKSVNIGTNRWSYKFELTPVILQMGKFALESTVDATFYTDNDDYGTESATLSTDPLFSLQTHLSYNVTDTFWVGMGHYYYSGGETEISGVDQDDKNKTQALRFSASFNLAPNVIMLLQYQTETKRDNGLKQDYVGTRLAYVW